MEIPELQREMSLIVSFILYVPTDRSSTLHTSKGT